MIKKQKINCTNDSLISVKSAALFLFISMMAALGCQLSKKDNHENQYGPYRKAYVNVDTAFNQAKRLLKNDSVDNILIIKYSCQDCLFENYDLNESYKGKFLAVKSTPVYIFWTKNNRSFIKKIDQFGYYATISRPAIYDYALYDFYKWNKQALESEKVLANYKDFTTEETKWMEQNKINYMQPVFTYYQGAPNGPTYNRISIEHSGLELYFESGQSIFKRYLDLSKFRPMVPADVTAQGMTHTIPYANNTDFYYHNQMLKINIWMKLVESQLFELEARTNWIPEKELTK